MNYLGAGAVFLEKSGVNLPSISIVTPSFNQGEFLEEAMLSVLEQKYPKLEYIVMDGASPDGSREIIGKYSDRLSFWVSEKDEGQYDAINKGFGRSSGEIMGWLNSDDKLLPWALQTVGEIFGEFPEVEWITSLFPFGWDASGRAATCRAVEGYSKEAFMGGGNLPGGGWPATDWIQQESTFWRRGLWEEAGGRMDSNFSFAGDFELWARFFKTGAELVGVPLPLGGFRGHGNQKSRVGAQKYFEEAKAALLMHGGKLPSKMNIALSRKLEKAESSLRKRRSRLVTGKCKMTNLQYGGATGKWNLRRI